MVPIKNCLPYPCYESFGFSRSGELIVEYATILPFRIINQNEYSYIYLFDNFSSKLIAQIPKIKLAPPEILMPKLKAISVFA